MPMNKQQRVAAAIQVRRARANLQQVIDDLKQVVELAKGHDIYVGYDMDDNLYALRRLHSDLGQQAEDLEQDPDYDSLFDRNDNDEEPTWVSETEPLERARDAAHEERYGPRD